MKRIFLTVFIIFVCIFSTHASLSENDGSAFITKAEFDSLKNNFQSQIDNYNTNIDSKIDNAIASYLSGLKIITTMVIPSELNAVKSSATLGRENLFGKAWGNHTFTRPNGVWSAYIYQQWGQGPAAERYLSGALIFGNKVSLDKGSTVFTPQLSGGGYNTDWNAFKPLTCLETKKVNVGTSQYRTLASYKLFENKYCFEGNAAGYQWTQGVIASASTADAWTIKVNTSKYTSTDADNMIPWSNCVQTMGLNIANATRPVMHKATLINSVTFQCEFRSYYKQTFTNLSDIGFCTDSLSTDIYNVDIDQWSNAWWDDGSDPEYTSGITTDGFINSADVCQVNYCISEDRKALRLAGGKYKVPVYYHKSEKMNYSTILNDAAMNARHDITQPVYFYNGLPLCYCTSGGLLTIKLNSKAKNGTTFADDPSATYNGTLYLSTAPFGQNTTQSNVHLEDGTLHTGGWTFSNTDKNQTIKIKVNSGDEIWLKYNVNSVTSGDLIEFETDSNNGLLIESIN